MNITELAKQLGISRQVLHRHIKRGCPTESVDAAIDWRNRNLDVTQTKGWRIDGNHGVRRGAVQNKAIPTNTIIRNAITEALTNVVPRLWFSQIGWLGSALRDHGVKVTAEELIKIQSFLFMLYMDETNNYLETESTFTLPESLMARPGDQTYSSLVEQLNVMLNKEPKQLYEA